MVSAVGRHHTLETAVADLVDNSVDAGATTVVVRFLLEGGHAVGLQVIDDGCGMDSVEIDHAMTYARQRNYDSTDLGHFGIGLKAASLSQADTLLVWSRASHHLPTGRRLRRETLATTPVVESFDTDDARDYLEHLGLPAGFQTGTVVEWRDVRTFLGAGDPREQSSWLSRTTDALRIHLGTVFHRILARGDLTVQLVQREGNWDGLPAIVPALDPFPDERNTQQGFPWTLEFELPGHHSAVHGSIWHKRGIGARGYRLDGRPPIETQGLYVYRRDRLLQQGAWNGLVTPDRDLGFARLALDIDDLGTHVTFNPEKAGVTIDATLREALLTARTQDGYSFQDYLKVARAQGEQSRSRTARRITVVEPGAGIPAVVRQAFHKATDFVPGEQPFRTRWSLLPEDRIVDIDLEEHVLLLNVRHRTSLGGIDGGRNDDAPVVKALLALLVGDHFARDNHGPRITHELDVLNTILTAAVHDVETRP
ncbi:ATP-binding protein [Kocuria sp. CPCC 205231]|uniref:ATP-binding protein n=1 Tax=Kocuria sp. CPCC 205231 TaxID=3073551 RepID=UPI0034D62191